MQRASHTYLQNAADRRSVVRTRHCSLNMRSSLLLPWLAAATAYAQQCVVSTVTVTVDPTTPPPTTTPSATPTTTPSPTTSGGSGSGGSPPTTLLSGYAWIRAVETPNFHKYLQSNPVLSAAEAILGSTTSAGQFKVVNGQLEYAIDSTGSKVLYASVGAPASASATILPVSFSTSPESSGTFTFSGDSLQWTSPSYTRPNPGAWLVCADQTLYINLGNYGYQTPSGCNDATVSPCIGHAWTDDADQRHRFIHMATRLQTHRHTAESCMRSS
jgi:hypothetical protein